MAKNLMSLLRQPPKLRIFHQLPQPPIIATKTTHQARLLLSLKNPKINATHLRIGAVSSFKVEETGHSLNGFRRFTTKATHVNDAGSIDSPLIQSMEKKIKEELNAESVIVKDAYSDGRHVSIDVISSAFEGQSAVNRQRMVYKVIWEELQNTVHAVDQMTTRTPSEAAGQKL